MWNINRKRTIWINCRSFVLSYNLEKGVIKLSSFMEPKYVRILLYNILPYHRQGGNKYEKKV